MLAPPAGSNLRGTVIVSSAVQGMPWVSNVHLPVTFVASSDSATHPYWRGGTVTTRLLPRSVLRFNDVSPCTDAVTWSWMPIMSLPRVNAVWRLKPIVFVQPVEVLRLKVHGIAVPVPL